METDEVKRPRYWPRPNRLLEAMREGRMPLLFMTCLNTPSVIEIIAAQGADAVLIDREHTSAGLECVENLVRAAEVAGITAVVRIAELDSNEVTRVLDLGAQGIWFPHVKDVEQARRARRSVLYAPRGDRGFAGSHSRSAMWTPERGSGIAPSAFGKQPKRYSMYTMDYIEAVNASIATFFALEDVEAIEQIDAILDAGKPDGVCIGWADVSVAAEFKTEKIRALADRVYEACQSRRIGVAFFSAVDKKPAFPGCFCFAGIDSVVFAEALGHHIETTRDWVNGLAKTTD